MSDYQSYTSSSSPSAPSLPIWFSQGHIRDDHAKELQAKMPQASANVKFLSTLQKPELGMRTETTIHNLDGTSFRMTGMITSIGMEPTVDQLSQSDSLLWKILSTQNPCARAELQAQTPQYKKDFISSFVGSVQGQRLASIAALKEPFLFGLGPISNDCIVEITYRFNDNMYYPWVVEHFRVLEQKEIEAYAPAFFYEFYGGSSYTEDGRCDHNQEIPTSLTDHEYFHSSNNNNYVGGTFV